MAISTSLFSTLFITLLLFVSIVQAHETTVDSVGGIERSLLDGNIDCGMECSRRCQVASRQDICLRACGTCCARCSCVPPGTSGNEDVCPCYANMTTHGGRKKCP